MPVKEIRLNKEQFKLFNDDDQFNILNADGFSEYEDFDVEVDKLFQKFDYIVVTDNDYIYGVKNNKREELSDQAFEGYGIALEVTED